MLARSVLVLLIAIAVAVACSEKKGPVKPPACECGHQGDMNGDTLFDVADVITIIGIAFNGAEDPVDPACPHIGRADCNCDCTVDSSDARYIIECAFGGGPRPCNPCAEGNECPRDHTSNPLGRH